MFKYGSFYISFDEDATILNSIFNYKLVKLKNNIKAGFPIKLLDDNIKVIDDKKINYLIVDNKVIVDKKGYIRNKFNNYTKSVFSIVSDNQRIENIVKRLGMIDYENKNIILDKIEDLLGNYGR